MPRRGRRPRGGSRGAGGAAGAARRRGARGSESGSVVNAGGRGQNGSRRPEGVRRSRGAGRFGGRGRWTIRILFIAISSRRSQTSRVGWSANTPHCAPVGTDRSRRPRKPSITSRGRSVPAGIAGLVRSVRYPCFGQKPQTFRLCVTRGCVRNSRSGLGGFRWHGGDNGVRPCAKSPGGVTGGAHGETHSRPSGWTGGGRRHPGGDGGGGAVPPHLVEDPGRGPHAANGATRAVPGPGEGRLETGPPPCRHLPRTDVRLGPLRPGDTVTRRPRRGRLRHGRRCHPRRVRSVAAGMGAAPADGAASGRVYDDRV